MLWIFFTSSILAATTGLLFINFLSHDFYNPYASADLSTSGKMCGLIRAQEQVSFDIGLGTAELSGMREEVGTAVLHQNDVVNSILGVGYRIVDDNFAAVFFTSNFLGKFAFVDFSSSNTITCL